MSPEELDRIVSLLRHYGNGSPYTTTNSQALLLAYKLEQVAAEERMNKCSSKSAR